MVKLLVVSALIIMVTAFVLAQSRGAWISFGISILVMTYMLIRRRSGNMKSSIKNMTVLVLLAAAVISLAYFGKDVITERVSGAISAEPAGDSFATRVKIWQGSLDMIRHNPIIGTGIGTFIWGFPRYRPEGLNGLINFAHNDYLEAACDMGIPAVLIMLWIFVIVIKKGIGVDSSSYYRLGCAIGVLSLSLHALSDFNFHIPANMLLFTVYLAIIMKARE
jgi:O-antigen ligase